MHTGNIAAWNIEDAVRVCEFEGEDNHFTCTCFVILDEKII